MSWLIEVCFCLGGDLNGKESVTLILILIFLEDMDTRLIEGN